MGLIVFEYNDWRNNIKRENGKIINFPLQNNSVDIDELEVEYMDDDFEKTIDVLTVVLKEDPENIDAQLYVLDALFALGRDENSFEWDVKPLVIRISKTVADDCY
ncbi:MAG: hypothetical protein KAX49_05280 [Halanaerobiales bacterium]|nr:hypothetical protein [Halanaerobiales bacterium]